MPALQLGFLENLPQALRPAEWVPAAGGETAEPVLSQFGARFAAAALGGGAGWAGRAGGYPGRAAGQR